MNILLIAMVLTATRMVSGTSSQDTPLTQSSIHDTTLKSQSYGQSLTRVRETPSVVSEQFVPLKIYLQLSAVKWADTSVAHLTIARIAPSEKATTRIGKRELGQLSRRIAGSIRRWSKVSNKNSLKYTAVNATTHDDASSKDHGIVAFLGPAVGLVQYIHTSAFKRLPRGWKLELGENGGWPFVDIGENDRSSISAWFQEDDIQFVVFDFSTFVYGFEGDSVAYHVIV